MSKIGILGGSFDPIHNGHLSLAYNAIEELHLDKVIFIPTSSHPFKSKYFASNNDRTKMLEMAIEGNSLFEISFIEFNRVGISYTVDTITNLKELYKNSDIFFIVGADILLEIKSWKNPEVIFRLCNICTFFREGYDFLEYQKNIELLKKEFDINIKTIEKSVVEISSSQIRKMIKNGESINYYVPENVNDYIVSNNIYKET